MLITAPGPTVAANRPAAGRRSRVPALVAAVLALLGVGYRLALLVADVPLTNADEATMGLAARHIQLGREFPVYFYGQHYMGTLEAYLAAPLFALAEPSVLALRLPNLVLYAAFLGLIWLLTRRLYTPWLATFTVALLALGSDRVLKDQLIAGGGYPEMNPAGALLVLLAVNLGLGAVRRRTLGYAAWGLVAGLMLWTDWLVLPYVAAAGVLLLGFRRRELRGRAGVVLAAGAVLGAAPLIVHDLSGRPNAISVFVGLTGAGESASWPDRLYGAVLLGLPMGTGMCAPGRCEPWQMWWGLAWPLLLITAGVLAFRALRRATGGERVRQAGRLALVVAAGVSLLSYARSGAAGTTPVESARYLSCLLVSTPAVLWPLWSAAGRARRVGARVGRQRAKRSGARGQAAGVLWQVGRQRAKRSGARGQAAGVLWQVAAAVPLAAVLVTALVATAALVAQASSIGRVADQRRELVSGLRDLGVTHLYSDYWTCNNITFASREEIVCAVLADDLRAGLDRYPPYRDLVARADRPAFAVLAGSPLGAAVAAHLRQAGAQRPVATVAGYEIYRPITRVDLPLP